MILLKVFFFLLGSHSFVQQPIVVTKSNGEELKFASVDFFQGDRRSDAKAIIYKENGVTKSIPTSELKRVNLKAIESRKGMTHWNAILVKTDNQKIEVILPLDRIYGIDDSGSTTKVPSSSIDKVSF